MFSCLYLCLCIFSNFSCHFTDDGSARVIRRIGCRDVCWSFMGGAFLKLIDCLHFSLCVPMIWIKCVLLIKLLKKFIACFVLFCWFTACLYTHFLHWQLTKIFLSIYSLLYLLTYYLLLYWPHKIFFFFFFFLVCSLWLMKCLTWDLEDSFGPFVFPGFLKHWFALGFWHWNWHSFYWN